MAYKQQTARKFVINSQDTYVIGDADLSGAGAAVIHLVPTTWSGTIKVKARARGKTAFDDDITFQQVPYIKRFLNNAVGDDTKVTTDITDVSIIIVPCSGQSIALDCTAFSTGTMTAYVHKIQGTP